METKHAEELKEMVGRLREVYGGTMTDDEVEFLQDVKGFIDFAIQNGLNFHLVVGTLSHDINGVLRCGTHLSDATAADFRPQVSGYGKLDADSVGGPEETE